MAEVIVTIGGKTFEVACQDGEEQFLQAAAARLDAEADILLSQIGRLPEARMLLMAGLMLADRTAGAQDQLRRLEANLARTKEELLALRSQPKPAPERVEVPVIPPSVTDAFAEVAARAESLAAAVEDRVKPR